jgi:hypothetical protein
MNLKSRLRTIEKHLPDKETTESDPVIKWLIENKHEEFIDCIKRIWRIKIKGENITEEEKEAYNKLALRVWQIRKQYSHLFTN